METNPLKLYFLPYLASGHLIPLTEMARIFANQGQDVTIITTPANATLLQKYVCANLALHIVELPEEEAGLDNSTSSRNDLDKAAKPYFAITRMRPHIEEFITSNPPDCILSDAFYPWTSDLAAQLGVPRLVFRAWGIFGMCLNEVMRGFQAQHSELQSAHEQFEIPGLPDRVLITWSEVPSSTSPYSQLMEMFREVEIKSYGILVNNFYELDSAYTDLYKKIMGHTVWNIGPTSSFINRNTVDKVERGRTAAVTQHECLGWLDTKKPNSVMYICYGSAAKFPDEQLYEIACALKSCKVQFIWVVFGKENEVLDSNTKNWLPQGFEEMIHETGQGMIIRGWAPQVLILDHAAIGGFLTHCGWNSVIEAISFGAPMVTWPLHAEQFYNEKLVVQFLKIGAEVGVKDWTMWVDAKRKLVKQGNIEAAIKKVMDDGDEGSQMRRKAKDLKEKAKQAVEDGGSSHQNLFALIQALKQIKSNKTKN